MHPSTCFLLAQGERTVAWSGQSCMIMTLTGDLSDSLIFLFDYGYSLWSDNFLYLWCGSVWKIELIFLCFREMFWGNSVYYTSGTVWAPIASVQDSGENIDQTVACILQILHKEVSPCCQFLSICVLIPHCIQLHWFVVFLLALESFVLAGISVLTISFCILAKIKTTQTNQNLFPCYNKLKPQMRCGSRAGIFQPTMAGLNSVLPLVKPVSLSVTELRI